jgi:hypothetical protein
LKTVSFPKIHHVGSLNPADKNRRFEGSYEGAGLSVSQHPDEWRAIARLGAAPEWVGVREGNEFLAFHDLTADDRNAIRQWAFDNNYLTETLVWRVLWFDDELDTQIWMDFGSLEEAEEQAEAVEAEIEEIFANSVTERLSAVTKTNAGETSGAFDLAATVFVEQETQLDGVWWEDVLDQYAYSAPRGVIVPSRVPNWKFSPVG